MCFPSIVAEKCITVNREEVLRGINEENKLSTVAGQTAGYTRALMGERIDD
jgi:sRNA-binding carbon storage regulator CsrA